MKKVQLQHFLDIVDAGSINKASEKLYITQPTLSSSMKALEEEMGKELLERTPHGIKLTPIILKRHRKRMEKLFIELKVLLHQSLIIMKHQEMI